MSTFQSVTTIQCGNVYNSLIKYVITLLTSNFSNLNSSYLRSNSEQDMGEQMYEWKIKIRLVNFSLLFTMRITNIITMYVAHIIKRAQSVSLTVFPFYFPYSYYMDGRVNKVEDFLKTRLLDTLTEQITKVTKVLVYPYVFSNLK